MVQLQCDGIIKKSKFCSLEVFNNLLKFNISKSKDLVGFILRKSNFTNSLESHLISVFSFILLNCEYKPYWVSAATINFILLRT